MREFPVIKFAIVFTTGIILDSFINSSIELNLVLLGSLFFFLAVAYLAEKRKSSFTFTSVIIFLQVLLIGYTSANLEQRERNFLPDSLEVVKNFTAYGTVVNINLSGANRFSFILKSDSGSGGVKFNHEVRFLCRVSDKNSERLYDRICPGNLVRVSGTYIKGREERNPGEFDYNKYLHSKNISGIISLYNIKNVEKLSEQSDALRTMIFNMRKTIDRIITGLHTKQTSALLKGLILADRGDISSDTKNQFINAGVVHILAVSGLHVGFIILIFYTLFGRFNLYLRSILTIAVILLFMILTGVPPSVFRASVMSIVIIVAYMLNRTTNIYNSLAAAAVVILAVTPSELFNPGFQLSFSAVLSIAYFYPVLRKQIYKTGVNNNILKYLLLFMAVSASAQIGTLPFTLYYFGRVSILAVFTNLLVIPLTGVIIGTALLSLVLFPFFPWGASVYASANNLFSYLLFRVVEFTGELKYSVIEVRNYSSINAFIFFLFILAGILMIRYLNSAKSRMIFILLILCNIILYSTIINDSGILKRNKLSVFMIDVGQGDSFLVQFPDGETALIDAGNATQLFDNGERIILPLLNQLGIDKIDYGFVSHIDSDHYGGFVSLIKHEKIRKIFKPPTNGTSKKDILFENYLRSQHIDVEYYYKRIVRVGTAEIFILNGEMNKSSVVSSNNMSGILKIEYGKNSFLFTGDLEEKGENYYRERYGDFLNTNVLKIAHHGSRTSSSAGFIKDVSPQITLISCGIKNKYNNPSAEVIRRLGAVKSLIYRTDREGGVLLQSDGIVIKKIDWRNYY